MQARGLIALVALAAAVPLRADGACQRLEDRLTEAELASVGLTDAQRERLNVLLCAGDASPAVSDPVPRAVRDPAPVMAGLDVGETSGRLRGRIEGWEPGTEFRFDDGQVWKVLKGRHRLPRPVDAPTVRLVPGLAGRWFLEIDPDAPKARVYRID